jgi:chorismate mutase
MSKIQINLIRAVIMQLDEIRNQIDDIDEDVLQLF